MNFRIGFPQNKEGTPSKSGGFRIIPWSKYFHICASLGLCNPYRHIVIVAEKSIVGIRPTGCCYNKLRVYGMPHVTTMDSTERDSSAHAVLRLVDLLSLNL